MTKDEYRKKLLSPRWNLKRLEILERDNFTCLRCQASGVPLHVHHVEYLPGRDPWDYENRSLQTLCARCHNDITESQQQLRFGPSEVRGLVEMLADRFELKPKRLHGPTEPRFDADHVFEFVRHMGKPLHGPLMRFATWVWNSGTRDMESVVEIVKDRCHRNPDNPFSYYAPGSVARMAVEGRVAIASAERQSRDFRKADARFFSQSNALTDPI